MSQKQITRRAARSAEEPLDLRAPSGRQLPF